VQISQTLKDDGAVGEAASSLAFKMTPVVGAVGVAASPPAPEQDNAIVGGSGLRSSDEDGAMLWCQDDEGVQWQ
jgi:hypothetical protein